MNGPIPDGEVNFTGVFNREKPVARETHLLVRLEPDESLVEVGVVSQGLVVDPLRHLLIQIGGGDGDGDSVRKVGVDLVADGWLGVVR